MSTATDKAKKSLNSEQVGWLKRMGMVLGIALHVAAPHSAVTSSTSRSSQKRAPVVGTSQPGSTASVSSGQTGIAAASSNDKRVIQAAGGYVFEQHADGKIFIIRSPKHGDERVEVKKSKDSKAYDAIRKQIGPFAKASTAVSATPATAKGTANLGGLSSKYETGGRGSETVSTGKGDPGGVSYGSYQLSSTKGTAQKFVDQYYAEWFDGKTPGTEEFDALWKKLAKEHGTQLAANEHQFISDTHYQPLADRLKTELGLDLEKHSKALRDVAWSISVQHGGKSNMFHKAIGSIVKEKKLDQLTDEEIIKLVYGERGRVNADGVPVYFSKSSSDVQKGVLKRFASEQQDALTELAAETPAKTP